MMKMKSILAAAVITATATIGMASFTTTPARADGFAFSFDTGDVAFGYRDGYWDRDHRWHRWRSGREAREFRTQYSDRYWHRHHYRERNAGWRDWDRDGVPNRFDSAPRNPYRV